MGLTIIIVLGTLASTSSQRGQVQWNYIVGFLITVFIYSVFALGLSLEFGSTGLLNFGHVAFMAIGAYAYGILMLPTGARPAEAASLVGAMYDAAPAFQGATVAGFLVALLVALLAGIAIAIPVLVAFGRFGKRLSPRVRLFVGFGVGALVALVVMFGIFPLGESDALNAAAFVSMLIGIMLAAIAGILLGLPTVRLREDYLAIVTIGAAEILRSILLNEEEWTRGTRNIVQFQRPIIDWALSSDWWRDFANAVDVRAAGLALMVAGLLAFVLFFVVLEALSRSPWGRVQRAIREDEDAAASLGKNVLWYKLQSLMVGSAIAAVAGILLVTYLSIISPQHFVPLVTFYAFIIVVIGGAGNHKAALAGSFLLWGIFALSQNLPAQFRLDAGPPQGIFIGAALVLVMMFRPQGLLGHKEEMAHAK